MFVTIIFIGLVLFNEYANAAPQSLLQIKYPLTRDEAFHQLKEKSDFIFDFYNPRPMDIIEGADAGRTVRAKVRSSRFNRLHMFCNFRELIFPC